MTKSASDLPCILVVDDDEDQLFLTRRMLERAGVKRPIVEVIGGPEAIQYLGRCCSENGVRAADAPALVFLDLKMPTADGFAVLSWIRTQDALRAMKVIVLTSSDDPNDVKRCTALGAHGFLVKHPSPMVVGCVLRQALGVDAIDAPVTAFAPSAG
jgi:CheY-like chemotaxis protein